MRRKASKNTEGDEVSTNFQNNSVSWCFQDVPIPFQRDMPVNLQFPKQTSRSGEVKAKTTGTSRCKSFPEYPDVLIQKKVVGDNGDNPSKDIPKSNHEFTNGTSSYHFLATLWNTTSLRKKDVAHPCGSGGLGKDETSKPISRTSGWIDYATRSHRKWIITIYSDSDFLVIPHHGPLTYWYPGPFAERTGAGTPSGDIGLTAPRVVRKIEKPQAMKPWQHGNISCCSLHSWASYTLRQNMLQVPQLYSAAKCSASKIAGSLRTQFTGFVFHFKNLGESTIFRLAGLKQHSLSKHKVVTSPPHPISVGQHIWSHPHCLTTYRWCCTFLLRVLRTF